MQIEEEGASENMTVAQIVERKEEQEKEERGGYEFVYIDL